MMQRDRAVREAAILVHKGMAPDFLPDAVRQVTREKVEAYLRLYTAI